MSKETLTVTSQIAEKLTKSAVDKKPITGLTHNFYRYPARFSPSFASTAIEIFSSPGDLILDPYMGGGTTIVEALIAGRRVVGTDLNSLAVFVTRVKTTTLSAAEKKIIISWANEELPQLSYRCRLDTQTNFLINKKTKNLTLPRAKFIKKVITSALTSLDSAKSPKAKDFIRCVILKTGQWAIDGRKTHTSLTEFRTRLTQNIYQMLDELKDFERLVCKKGIGRPRRSLIELDASQINTAPIFSKRNLKADLVVTSPPYPGLHILYHRWQVNGRRETPAPYWIAGCEDGQGDSYYNFGSRQQIGLHSYFETSLRTLKAIRKVIRHGGHMVQMVAFSDPKNHLPRYLANMKKASFSEVKFYDSEVTDGNNRIWRTVPNRKWHASLQGNTSGSKEVILIHQAV